MELNLLDNGSCAERSETEFKTVKRIKVGVKAYFIVICSMILHLYALNFIKSRWNIN